MPKSLIFVPITLLVFILQVPWIPGLLLFVVGAPFWSVLTVNAVFAGTAYEALTGRVPRIWLVVPILFYGGYGAAAFASHIQLTRLEHQLAQHNEALALPFSAERYALVIDASSIVLTGTAATLVEKAAIPVVYTTDAGSPLASHVAWRLGSPATCRTLKTTPGLYRAEIYSSELGDRDALAKGLCEYSMPADPDRAAFRVEAAAGRKVETRLLRYQLDTIQVSAPDGKRILLLTGQAEPLSWLPLPVMGCGLVPKSWTCSTFFAHGDRQDLTRSGESGSAAAVIANALGLALAPASSRRATLPNQPPAEIQQLLEKRLKISLANLDSMLAGSSRHFSALDVLGLDGRPDLLGPRAERMTSALSRAMIRGYPAQDEAEILRGLLANLAPGDFARMRGPILHLYAPDSVFATSTQEDPLLTRIGDYGEQALPALQTLAFGGSGNPSALLGLCRVGAPAAGLAPRVAAYIGKSHTMAYAARVTLLRFGRRDLLAGLGEKDARYHAPELARVGPSSPPSVCINAFGYPKLPGAAAP